MKKIVIILLMTAAFAGCKKKVDEDVARRAPSGSSGIRYYHDERVDKCFYRASEWHMTSNVNGEVLTLRETECGDKLKAIAEKIGAPEAERP